MISPLLCFTTSFTIYNISIEQKNAIYGQDKLMKIGISKFKITQFHIFTDHTKIWRLQ